MILPKERTDGPSNEQVVITAPIPGLDHAMCEHGGIPPLLLWKTIRWSIDQSIDQLILVQSWMDRLLQRLA